MTEEEKKLRKTIFEKIEQKYKLHFRDRLIIGMAITEKLTEKDKQIEELKSLITKRENSNIELLDFYEKKLDKIADLENKLANVSYQLEGREVELKELQEENKKIYQRMTGLDEVLDRKNEQIEKMKCCGNCKYSRQASAYSIVCEVGGVDKSEAENVEDFLVCDKWVFGELAEYPEDLKKSN